VSDERPVLVLVSGLPGAGKTTYAKVLEQQLGAVRLCADDWLEELALDLWDEEAREQMEGLQWQVARRLLSLGVAIVIQWGTWSRAERDRIRDEARQLGARAELHHLDAPLDLLHQRVVARGREQLAIERGQLEQWQAMFEVPTEHEAALWDAFETVSTAAHER
jgi:predicted kinase